MCNIMYIPSITLFGNHIYNYIHFSVIVKGYFTHSYKFGCLHKKGVCLLSNIYNRVLQLCNERGIKVSRMCAECGVSPNAFSLLKLGKREGLSIKSATLVANYFNVSVDYILCNSDIRQPIPNIYPLGEIIEMPVLASVRGGYDGSAIIEYSDEMTSFPKTAFKGYAPDECSVLRVKGNSMYPEIKDGDLILVHRQASVDSGSIAVIIYNSDEATVKKVRYVQGEDWLELIPINPEYQTKRIEADDLEICTVFGLVISMMREF